LDNKYYGVATLSGFILTLCERITTNMLKSPKIDTKIIELNIIKLINLPRITLVIAALVTLDAIIINSLSGTNVCSSIYWVKQATKEDNNPTTML
jgi:hypothetical protein